MVLDRYPTSTSSCYIGLGRQYNLRGNVKMNRYYLEIRHIWRVQGCPGKGLVYFITC